MADDIQSAFKEVVAEKSNNGWMLFVAMGFAAGAIFGFLLNLDAMAREQARETCGLCQDNLNTMVSNYNALARKCDLAIPFARNVSNKTVGVYAS